MGTLAVAFLANNLVPLQQSSLPTIRALLLHSSLSIHLQIQDNPFETIVNHIDLCYDTGNFHNSMQHVRNGRMPDTPRQEIKLFYCYAHEDKVWRDELENHLVSLKRLYALRNWHDREILPGQEWEHAIEDSLNTAHLILLLISPDFIRSDYAYGKEMQRALERHEEGSCKVIPILLRPTFLDGAPFTKLQMLPTDAKPISRWPDRDEAFLNVANRNQPRPQRPVALAQIERGLA